MKVIPVERSKGSFIVRQGGKAFPFLAEGTAPQLSLGWTPIQILVGVPNLTVLQLQHENGRLALWYLDSEFRFVANEIAMLPAETLAAAIDQIPSFPDVPWDEFRRSGEPKATLRRKKNL